MTHARLAPGLRRLPAQALVVQAQAETFSGLEATRTPGQCLAALKRASASLGLSPQAVALLDQLMAFSQPQDWREGARPIVWPSNDLLVRQFGVDARTLRRWLAELLRLGLLVAVDSPTGARWGRRDATGRIVEAYGFDLSPLAERFEEFQALAETLKAERARHAALRRRLTIARKAIRQIAETALEEGLDGRDWRSWRDEAAALAALAPDAGVPLAPLDRAVRALEAARRQGEAKLREALAALGEKGVRESAPADIRVRPNTTTNQPPSLLGRNEDRQGIGNGPGAHASPTSAGREKEDDHDDEDPPAPTPAFVLRVSPSLKRWLRHERPTWADVVEAADRLRRELGVSRAAWAEACQVLGRYGAATAVAIIAAKRGEIDAPGGYLRGMVARARKGELYLVRSLYGLADREAARDGDAAHQRRA